jgi:hypothetical protein
MKHSYLTAAAGAVVALGLSQPVSASPMIDITVIGDVGDAPATLNAFTAGKKGFITEDFEDLATQTSTNTLPTKVGTFEGFGTGDTSGSCILDCDEIQVLSSGNTPFNGRVDTTNGEDDGQWLDSNDLPKVVWTFDVTDNSSVSDADFGFDKFTDLAFFMTDVSDVGATLTVTFNDGSIASDTISGQGNGTINFVTAAFAGAATSATVTFENTAGDIFGDGFGIDDATIAVPLPATVGLFGIGLLGLGLLAGRRRNA